MRNPRTLSPHTSGLSSFLKAKVSKPLSDHFKTNFAWKPFFNIFTIMKILAKMNTLTHYAKNTWNAIKRPLAYVPAAAIILTTFNANEAQAQNNGFKNTNTEVIENAYGNLFIKNENDEGVEGAIVKWSHLYNKQLWGYKLRSFSIL